MPVARQIVRDYTLALHAAPQFVFPLLCPVREYEWIPGWSCDLVHTRSGVIEPGCIFRTHFHIDAIWYVTQHDPVLYQVGFVQVFSDVAVGRFGIQLEPVGGDRCVGRMRSELTALSPQADSNFEEFADARDTGLRRLEGLLNDFLDSHPRATSS